VLFLLIQIDNSFGQKNSTAPAGVDRPKLIVGIVIDQMRWDYLYRYNNLFGANGGFKRLLNNGFTCENTFIPYAPTVTAPGHACVYTGSVPAIHGIVGNGWYSKQQEKSVYCSGDSSVATVGSSNSESGKMSPRNMLTTTITDELRLATNFKSKVIGVAIKDRGAILPAGHAANAAYWYDNRSGNFITSTYYMSQLPKWVQDFNNRKVVDSLYKLNWNLSMPNNLYEQYSTADDKPYESKTFGKEQSAFPYDLSKYTGKDYGKIAVTPYGNTFTLEMAKAALVAEDLGKSEATDFLAVSLSSPDYIGHSFGPNSWEQMDDFIKLDNDLGSFFNFLDASLGKGQYTVFLTADHGVAHVAGYMQEHHLPAGVFSFNITEVNAQLKNKFGAEGILATEENYQLYLNSNLISSAGLSKKDITKWLVEYLKSNEAVTNAFELQELSATTLPDVQKTRIANGYFPERSGDIQYILKPGYYEGGTVGTTHGLWNPYDSHIPLLWYGWGIKHGSTNRETYMTDIAATVAALLHIQMPNGCVGNVIEEVMVPRGKQ